MPQQLNTHVPVHLKSSFNHLSQLMRQDPGDRRFAPAAPVDDFSQAIISLLSARKILVLTGFCILDAMAGETDGLTGALVLASTLSLLNKSVDIVTDKYSATLLKAGLQAGFPQIAAKIVFHVIPTEQSSADEALRRLFESFCPDHVIAIERPGKASDGHSYSMRGELLNHVIPQFDSLFETCRRRACPTLAIGDGGNELGMGRLKTYIHQHVLLGDKIACITPADYLIPTGVSNWAGYGLAAALSLITGNMLCPPAETEIAMLKAMVAVGAVDGCTKKRTVTVDGLSLESYLTPIRQMIDFATHCLVELHGKELFHD
ncbi:DUF4392 domain-containing protein [Anoxynatronum buryatiense]|uniref:D-glutamate cyclase-like C-terminal domain-containing protein n=1 Tax=Anoxynatronum buryatiense TaxID=489973 RepID=A0AA45WTW4_9CLOT|nr:DUF4392 domain-containing protein [Anoxynatronum buryatiense]SMP44850.1 protein of unknown function [Anoxynatronum buryatiense]